MEHYRCHKAYILPKRAECISHTVDFFLKQFNMPQMSSTDTTIHATQSLIHALHNPDPVSPLYTLGN